MNMIAGCDMTHFEINLIFLMKLFFLNKQKSQDKNLYILRANKDSKMK